MLFLTKTALYYHSSLRKKKDDIFFSEMGALLLLHPTVTAAGPGCLQRGENVNLSSFPTVFVGNAGLMQPVEQRVPRCKKQVLKRTHAHTHIHSSVSFYLLSNLPPGHLG